MMELVNDRLIDRLIAIAMLALALHFGSRYLVFIEEGKRGGEVLSLLSLGYPTTHSVLFAARQLKSSLLRI